MIFFIFSQSINKLTNSETNRNEESHTYKNARKSRKSESLLEVLMTISYCNTFVHALDCTPSGGRDLLQSSILAILPRF
jgi:hypothetical protein